MNTILVELKQMNLEIWLPILISLITLIYTILNNNKLNKRTKKNEESNKLNEQWKKDFEIYKEEIRQKDMINTKLLTEISTRASIVPYFNIVLNDNRIKRDKDSLILEVGLINIGKESATNIQLDPLYPEKKLEGYFISKAYPGKQYHIYEYLSQYYAMATEEVTFKIGLNLPEGKEMSDFLNFRIKYEDLIGNTYHQEFRFGFYMINNSLGYSLDNSSYIPTTKEK
ncbi:TPA: hypothetical protein ACJOTB_001836 [Streptococcus pyogenes]